MSAEPRVEWTGNIEVHHPATPATPTPAPEHHLIEGAIRFRTATFACSGCSWTVDVHPVPDAEEQLIQAFNQHLIAAEIEALRTTDPSLYTAITERDPVTDRAPEEAPPTAT